MSVRPEFRTAAELGLRVDGLPDLSDLIGSAYGLAGLIVRESDLGPAFFDLESGLAGELFQKLVNYGLPTALVFPGFAAHGERFVELAREHARHPQLRFVYTEADARTWLASLLQ